MNQCAVAYRTAILSRDKVAR